MENNEQNNDDLQRSALEARIKKIDEQISLLNTIKSQSLAKLQSLPKTIPQQSKPVVNNQTLEDKIGNSEGNSGDTILNSTSGPKPKRN